MSTPAPEAPSSALSPFRHRAFAVIWVATLVSNIGVWMQSAAAGWLMTSLAPDARYVALVQVASALPMFLLGLPAGAFADIFDRRRLLLTMEMAGTALTAGFAVLVATGNVTAVVLLGFVFLASAAAASIAPAWEAIVPQLVERRQDLAPAVALNSGSVNVSRAIGPALAGVLIGASSMAAPYWINAVCNLGCIAALFWWRPAAHVRDLPPERVGSAILVGLRHARYNLPLRATLARASGFFLFASAYWALLPLLAREQLGGGPQTYGMLLGAIGLGAVGGTLVLHRLKAWLGADGLVVAGSLGTAVALVLFAIARATGLALLASAVAGLSWIAVLSTLNVSAQTALPGWVRGRGLATYATVMFGATTLGALAWGQTASALGLPIAHAAAAAGLVVAIVLLREQRVQSSAGLDLRPSMYWPEPVLSDDVDDDRGPVLVTIEYDIEGADRAAFLSAVYRQGAARKRNGAYRWGIFEDAAAPSRWVETFLIDSWLDYLRQRERLTKADQQLEAEVRSHQAQGEPRVSRFIGPECDPNRATGAHDGTTIR